MTLLTDFRHAVMDLCSEATGIPITPGKFNGPVQNGDAGCCYPVGIREGSKVVEQVLEVRVRLFKNISAAIDPAIAALDPDVLEDLIETCQAALGDGDQAFGGTWYGRLTEAEVNMEWFGIEMAIVALSWNRFAVVAPTG